MARVLAEGEKPFTRRPVGDKGGKDIGLPLFNDPLHNCPLEMVLRTCLPEFAQQPPGIILSVTGGMRSIIGDTPRQAFPKSTVHELMGDSNEIVSTLSRMARENRGRETRRPQARASDSVGGTYDLIVVNPRVASNSHLRGILETCVELLNARGVLVAVLSPQRDRAFETVVGVLKEMAGIKVRQELGYMLTTGRREFIVVGKTISIGEKAVEKGIYREETVM